MRPLIIVNQIANRDYVSMDRYIQKINTLNTLPVEEEVLIVRQIKNGDRKALETLVNVNLRFVVCIAKRFQNHGLTLPDLIIEGNLGLIKAAERFDETRGFKFNEYAVWCIRQSIIRAIAENLNIIRIPLNKIGLLSKVYCTLTKLEQYFQREPRIDEIAGMLKFHRNIVEEALQVTDN